jgi:hypothetical protein
MHSTLLHEVQHYIQDIEGHAMGSSPETMAAKMTDFTKVEGLVNKARTVAVYAEKEGHKVPELRQLINEAEAVLQNARVKAHAEYKKAYGEVEARMTQWRQFLSPEQRDMLPPWATEPYLSSYPHGTIPEKYVETYGGPSKPMSRSIEGPDPTKYPPFSLTHGQTGELPSHLKLDKELSSLIPPGPFSPTVPGVEHLTGAAKQTFVPHPSTRVEAGIRKHMEDRGHYQTTFGNENNPKGKVRTLKPK